MAGSEGWRMFLFEQLTTDPGKARGLWRSIVCTHQTDWIRKSCQQLIDQSKFLYRIYVYTSLLTFYPIGDNYQRPPESSGQGN